jgi:periplasmic protein TonB
MKLLLTAALLFALAGTHAQDSTRIIPKPKDSVVVSMGSQDTVPDYRIFTKVEIEASFPGGSPAWLRFLNHNLRYPVEAQNDNVQGDIIVQFQVDKQGVVSDVEAISGPTNGGLREEAERIIKISGKWTAAVQNGYKVNSFKRQKISFKIVNH